MEIRNLYVSQLRQYAPLETENSRLDEITDKRLKRWALEICTNVFDEGSDLPRSKEQGTGNEGDN